MYDLLEDRYHIALLGFFVFCLTPLSADEIFRSSCRTDGLFKITDRNAKLDSIKISSLKVPSLSICARNCIKESSCLSINYNPGISSQENCELLASNKSTIGASLISSTGWKHYNPVTQQVIELYYTYLQNKRMRRCGVAPPTNNFRKT